MFVLEGAVVTSPSDLNTASKCEFAFARLLDGKLGRITIEKVARDALEQRAPRLGHAHQSREAVSNKAVSVFDRQRPRSAPPLRQQHVRTCPRRRHREGDLASALAELHDEWIEGRRSLGLEVLGALAVLDVLAALSA